MADELDKWERELLRQAGAPASAGASFNKKDVVTHALELHRDGLLELDYQSDTYRGPNGFKITRAALETARLAPQPVVHHTSNTMPPPVTIVNNTWANNTFGHTSRGNTPFMNDPTANVNWYNSIIDNQPLRDGRNPMLEQLIKMYSAYMKQDVRSPIPHLAGPPGTNKSGVVQTLADELGVNLHIVNVSRMSPLEIEGIQMPIGTHEAGDHRLSLLTSTLWTQLREGDIVLLDEFMRGFPEVYNGLLDIMTARQVAGFHLPKVFFVGASNSVAAYDKALEDRLLHIFVPDLRKHSGELNRAKFVLVDQLGLNPGVAGSQEMQTLFANEVLPMYEILDQFTGKATRGTSSVKGSSLRKLIGQVQLREVQSSDLKELIDVNNRLSIQAGKDQFVVLLTGKGVDPRYKERALKLKGNPKLTPLQAINLEINLDMIEMYEATLDTATQEEKDIDSVFI